MTDLQEFTQGCIEALYFTETGDVDQPSSVTPLDDGSRLDLEADCRSFWHRFGCYITSEICEQHSPALGISLAAHAGHDFWLTRNGHGAGFWDGDWPEACSDMLTKASVGYGEFAPTFHVEAEGKSTN